jgi:hypothetical protein
MLDDLKEAPKRQVMALNSSQHNTVLTHTLWHLPSLEQVFGIVSFCVLDLPYEYEVNVVAHSQFCTQTTLTAGTTAHLVKSSAVKPQNSNMTLRGYAFIRYILDTC